MENIDNFNWKLTGNKLSVKYAGEENEDVGRVEKLTSTTLVTVYEWVSSDGMQKEYEKSTFTRVK